MRHDLPRVRQSHVGLAFDVAADFADDGKVDKDARQAWLDGIAAIDEPADWQHAFQRFTDSLTASGGACEAMEGTLAARLVIGHGNPSPVDFGLTVHHTWGVPIIPGSALKGLLATYLEAVFGPDPEPGDDAEARAAFAGPTWKKGRLVAPPGEVIRALFGAPDVPGAEGESAAARRGQVVFHDALFVPGSAAPPFARDVLTVHQRSYYGQGEAARQAGEAWPNDYDEPNPVAFLTVRPGARFLIALTGDASWCQFAVTHLKAALEGFGVGGKTTAGYGVFDPDGWRPVRFAPAEDSPVAAFLEWLEAERQGSRSQREIFEALRADWWPRLQKVSAPNERLAAGQAISKALNNKRLRAEVQALRDELDQ